MLPVLLLVPLAFACSSSGSEQPTATTTVTVTGTQTDVNLNEWEIQLDSATLVPDSYAFTVKNDGSQVHELVIVKTDAAVDDVPVSGGVAELDGIGTVVGSVKDMRARAEETLSVDLDAGNYLFICNIPGHFGLGMVTEVTVN